VLHVTTSNWKTDHQIMRTLVLLSFIKVGSDMTKLVNARIAGFRCGLRKWDRHQK